MRVATLLYHDVVADGAWESSGFPGAAAGIYKLDVDEFRRHLRAIAEGVGRPPVLVDELADSDRSRVPWVLTFDDGGVSAVTRIATLLDELGWKAHFFVTTSRIGTPGFLSAEQIRELRGLGHAIGSHSHNHPKRMSACTRDELLDEWRTSVERLREILGGPPDVASVPGGYYSGPVARAAADCGIARLFTSEPRKTVRRVGSCLVFGRYCVIRGDSTAKAAALASPSASRAQVGQALNWTVKKVAKTLGGSRYIALRRALLERRGTTDASG